MVHELRQGAKTALGSDVHLVRKAGQKLKQLEKRSENLFQSPLFHWSEDMKIGGYLTE